MSGAPVIVLFRRDLRLGCNPALAAAADSGAPVIPLFVLDDHDPFPIGGAAKWWLHHSLDALGESIKRAGAKLLLRRSKSADALVEIASETGAEAVFAARRYLTQQADADTEIEARLATAGVEWRTFAGELLREPSEMRVQSTGGPYQVFTPFFRALSAIGPDDGVAEARAPKLKTPKSLPASERLEDWGLLPTRPNWAKEFSENWAPGEDGAIAALEAFFEEPASRYAEERDKPGIVSTSRLSPHLAFGEIAPAYIWRETRARAQSGRLNTRQAEKFLSEVAWREFSHHLLAAFPRMAKEPLRKEFAEFPWARDDGAFDAWKRGETGYPIVDAGMRELWRTGWMHNRVRMIVASFLVKDLLISWRDGEAWFQDTLVDYDPANNIANWQWVAGSGADAAPYFRIFNPTLQGEKFDPDGDYVKKYVAELSRMPSKYLHRPFEAPADVLKRAGVALGTDYPLPIVDHAKAREAALAALKKTKSASGN